MKKNPPMTNSTASAGALERRRMLSDNEADWKEAGRSGLREGMPGFDKQPPIQRIMKRAETMRSQDQAATSRNPMIERIAQEQGSMNKTREPLSMRKTTEKMSMRKTRKPKTY